MAKAAPEEQLRLLDLQALDSTLNKLARQAVVAWSNPLLATTAAQVADVDAELVRATTDLGDLQRELTRAEDEVQSVVTRLERDEKRLNSSTGLSKDLVALQHEIASLTKRRSDLEDVERPVAVPIEPPHGEHANPRVCCTYRSAGCCSDGGSSRWMVRGPG